MSESVELFFRAVRFTPIWGVIDLLCILHFFSSWYRTAQKTGWKIDFWHLTLFTGLFQSTLILYPFNASIYNAPATLGCLEKIFPFIDRAFAISILGYCFVWIGRYTFDWTHGRFAFAALTQAVRPLAQVVEANIKNRNTFILIGWVAAVLGLTVLAIQFAHGSFFNGRGFFLKSPYLRPLFNITVSIFPIALAFLALRYVQFKEKGTLKMFAFLLFLSLFFGVRFIFISGILFFFVQHIFYKEGRVSLLKLGVGCFGLLFITVFLGALRDGNYNPLYAFASLFLHFFYGNNFSDVRDFAWILSYWDGELLCGKSYVAALLSFIPRAFCSLREQWGFSLYTNDLVGFDSEIMPGLRPGLFGEPFLNFGFLGVVLSGWLFGFVLRYADHQIKQAVKGSKDVIKGYSLTVGSYFLQCMIITAGMWMVYVFVLLNLALIPFRRK